MNRWSAGLLLVIMLICGLNLAGQTVDLIGPLQLGRCYQGTFTVTFTNSRIQTASNIVFTNTMPATFTYVLGSASLTLHDGTIHIVDPSQVGLDMTWNLDGMVGFPYELPPGEIITVRFNLFTPCGSISGTNSVRVDYLLNGIPNHVTDFLSVEILPGAVRISKTPSITPARFGDIVTWVIRVESTGLGPVRNVVITDILGPGLEYVASIPAGTVSGQVIVWDSSTVPALLEILAGGMVEVQLQARVVACNGLVNTADARFGCDDGSICFDSKVDGGTATASIQFILENPFLSFTPPNILIPYCLPDPITVTMPVTNTGPGAARNVRISVNFPPTFTIQAVRGGAIWAAPYFRLPDLAAGEIFNLVYDLVYTGDWCAGGPSGTLFYQPIYNNVCGYEFRPPLTFGSYGTDYGLAGPPTLSVSISGPVEVHICTAYSYHILASFSGLTACAGRTTGDITVIASIPVDFTVTVTGGGTWVPGVGGTGGTITWVTPPTIPFSTAITLLTPGSGRCGSLATLSVTASAIDCCLCPLHASDSMVIAIECRDLVGALRVASPAVQEKCGIVTYTNTYHFANSVALDAVSFNELTFTEHADNLQDFVEGSLSITIDGLTAHPITVSDTTPGGTFQIVGINDMRSVRNRTLVISYQLGFTAGSAPIGCPGTHTFFSWSTLHLGPDCRTGHACAEYCTKSEVTVVTTATPSMSVSVFGLPDIIAPCGTYGITVVLTKTSDFDPHTVRLQLEHLNYYIIDLATISVIGVQPISTIPAGFATHYEWNFGDRFVGQPKGAQSTLTFQARKRCLPGLDLVATALFVDACGFSSCSVSDLASPFMMAEPLLHIRKTPQVTFATRNEITWTISVTNSGAGLAHMVWVEDVLGSGLEYVSSVVDGDVITSPNRDRTGAPINGVSWFIPVISAGGTRVISLTARLVACAGLTNDVRTGIACGGMECLPIVSDHSSVLIPASRVVATSYTHATIDICSTNWATITIRNVGTPAVYSLVARETMPAGLAYVPGSTQWRIDGGVWTVGGDPTITGSLATGYILQWMDIQIVGLTALLSLTTIEIRFQLTADCSFAGGTFEVAVEYLTVCRVREAAPIGLFRVGARQPSISVNKVQIPPGAIDCGAEVTWRIDITNTGPIAIPYIWVEDTLGTGFTFVRSQGDGIYSVDAGTNVGQIVNWELVNLPPGVTAGLHLTARDNATCGDLSNTIDVWWGCGISDRNSATRDALCLAPFPVTDLAIGSRTPAVVLAASFDVDRIETCGTAIYTFSMTNPSTATAHAIDTRITLPSGLSYVPGSTQIDCGAGFVAALDPLVIGGSLVWGDPLNPIINLCDTIPPAGTVRLRFTVQAACYTITGNVRATVYFQDCCFGIQHQRSLATPISPALPSLVVSKSPESVALDCHDLADTVTWTITVTNTGIGTADWVRIEDTLGDNLVYVSSSPPATPMGGGKWGWEFGPLAPGMSQVFNIEARLSPPADDCSPALRTNTARTTWGCGAFDGDPTTIEGCASGFWAMDTAIVTIPDLAASLHWLSLVCNNDATLTLQGELRNLGDAAAFGVVIRVYVAGATTPAYESVTNIPAGGVYFLMFTSPPLKCGEDHAFRVVVDEDNLICECNERNNEAIVFASCPCPALVTEKTVVQILRRGTIPVHLGTPIEAGDKILYRLRVRNVGQGRAFDVDLSDQLPIEFLYVAGSTSASWPGGRSIIGPAGAPGPTLFWDLSAELGHTEAVTLEFSAVVTSAIAPGVVYKNTMCATGREGDGTPIPPDNSVLVPADNDPDDCSFVFHVAAAVPALSVNKEIVDVRRGGASIWPTGAVEPGDLIFYRFTVRNVGDGTAYNVNFTDDLPAGLAYDDGHYTVSSPTQAGSLGIAHGATGHLVATISVQIDGGATLVAEFSALVTSFVQQGVDLVNTATATGVDGYNTPIPPENPQAGDTSDDDPHDPDPDDTGLETIGVYKPGFSLVKEIVDVLRGGATIWPTETVLPEDVIVYRVTVRNVGRGIAYNIDFFDTLPPGLEYDTDYGLGSYHVNNPLTDGILDIRDGATGALFADLSLVLAGGGTLTITYRTRVTPDAVPGTFLVNLAQISGVDDSGTPIPEYDVNTEDFYPDRGETRIRVGMPALVTSKAIYIDPCAYVIPSLKPGSSLQFVLTVQNVGYGPTHFVLIEDLLPVGLRYVPESTVLIHAGEQLGMPIAPLALPGGGFLVWETGLSLEAGEVLELIFTVTIDRAIPLGTILENIMMASGIDDLARPIVADASAYVPRDTDPDDASSFQFKVGDREWTPVLPPQCMIETNGEKENV